MKRESDLRGKKWNWLFSRYEEMEGCGLNSVSSVIDTIGFLSDSHLSFFCLSESSCLLCSTYSLHSSRPERSGYVMESHSSCCCLVCINEPACLQEQRWGGNGKIQKHESNKPWSPENFMYFYLYILMECVQCHSFSGMQSAVDSNIRWFCTVPMEMLIPKGKTNQRVKLNTIQTVTVSDWFLFHSETNVLCPIKRK